jgi:hypothetical protein
LSKTLQGEDKFWAAFAFPKEPKLPLHIGGGKGLPLFIMNK